MDQDRLGYNEIPDDSVTQQIAKQHTMKQGVGPSILDSDEEELKFNEFVAGKTRQTMGLGAKSMKNFDDQE